jgi:hypothetical protein
MSISGWSLFFAGNDDDAERMTWSLEHICGLNGTDAAAKLPRGTSVFNRAENGPKDAFNFYGKCSGAGWLRLADPAAAHRAPTGLTFPPTLANGRDYLQFSNPVFFRSEPCADFCSILPMEI